MANTLWNAADLSHITLSGGNLTATGSTIVSTPGGVRAVDPNSNGKFYWEVRVTTWTAVTSGVGISLAAANFANLANSGTSGMLLNRNGNVVMNSSNVLTGMGVQASGNTICLAVDVGARLFWVRSGIAGNWNNNVANNPATGVGGLSFSALGGAGTNIYPLITVGVNGDVFVADFGDTAFAGSVPSGFASGWAPGGGGAASAQAMAMILA